MATKTYYKSRGEELATRKTLANKGWETKTKQPVKTVKMVEGRAIPILVEREIDQAEIMQSYKPEMFMLENLIEIGAAAELTENRLMPSTLQTLDWLEEGASRELDRMDAEEWAKKYIKENQKEKIKENQKEKEE